MNRIDRGTLLQIQFILSDKTGTLTCNSMDFRKAFVGDHQYGSGDTDISKAAKERQYGRGRVGA